MLEPKVGILQDKMRRMPMFIAKPGTTMISQKPGFNCDLHLHLAADCL